MGKIAHGLGIWAPQYIPYLNLCVALSRRRCLSRALSHAHIPKSPCSRDSS